MRKVFESNAVYHSSNDISASGLKDIFSQSVNYKLTRKNKETDAMRFGTAVHDLLQEGKKEFLRRYYFMPKLDLRTKAGKEVKAEHLKIAKDRIVFDSQQGRDLFWILDNFLKNKLAVHYATGIIEQSHYLEFEGVPVRVRPDCHSDTWISDIKTTREPNKFDFKREVNFRNYDLQACFYSDCLGYDPKHFRFIAIRNTYPFDNGVYSLNEDQISRGRYKYEKALREWKHYLDTGEALGFYSDETNKDGSIIL